MSEGKKKALDPNATIQIDQLGGLDQVELIDESDPAPSAPPTSARERPPALPPSTSIGAPPAVSQPRAGRTVAYVTAVCVIIVAAMAAGLLVGNRFRGGAAAAPSASSAPPNAGAAPSASTLVLPTVEIGRH